jgi:hypothetical protein
VGKEKEKRGWPVCIKILFPNLTLRCITHLPWEGACKGWKKYRSTAP